MIQVGFKRLTDHAILPVKAHPTDSGFDLFTRDYDIIYGGYTKVIKTGISIHLPSGYEAQVRPRSGITSKTKLRVQLGTIDNSYTGEIGIIVDNKSKLTTRIVKGYKLAQLVIVPIPMIESFEIDELPQKERGSRGFGSSGYSRKSESNE